MMRTLTALSAIYLASASVFGAAYLIQHHPHWPGVATRQARAIWPGLRHAVADANTRLKPLLHRVAAADKAFFDAVDPPKQIAVATAPVRASAPLRVTLRPTIMDVEAPPPVTRIMPEKPAAAPPKPVITLAPPEPPAEVASASPTEPSVAASGEIVRVMQRLKDSLTHEMLENFTLFLYVSKADSGPWAQRMYVFRKEDGGDLDLVYNWPVSTGRERVEYTPGGAREPSFTPQGYYQLDPDRMFRRHVSGQWGSPMPHAMFFSWVKDGNQTGLAIHGASGDDVALLGRRASAGCVRLAPENAARLFELIRGHYKGLAPRFAYDRRTATMSNDGVLMHDAQGNVKFADGYKVLVFIENYGGQNVVAAMF